MSIQCFSKAHDDVLTCLVLSTTQRCLVYCQTGGKKPENIEIREFYCFLSNLNGFINYPNYSGLIQELTTNQFTE